jgi:hypothetical protein
MTTLPVDQVPLHLLQLADLAPIRASPHVRLLMGVRDAMLLALYDRYDPWPASFALHTGPHEEHLKRFRIWT